MNDYTDPMDRFKGPHNVLFSVSKEYLKIDIATIWRDSLGGILWIEDTDGAIYNWGNILVVRKIK